MALSVLRDADPPEDMRSAEKKGPKQDERKGEKKGGPIPKAALRAPQWRLLKPGPEKGGKSRTRGLSSKRNWSGCRPTRLLWHRRLKSSYRNAAAPITKKNRHTAFNVPQLTDLLGEVNIPAGFHSSNPTDLSAPRLLRKFRDRLTVVRRAMTTPKRSG